MADGLRAMAEAGLRRVRRFNVLLLTGPAVLLMLVFITDCIEYGHWKLGHRNAAVTFALQPFINKVGAALGTQIVSVVVSPSARRRGLGRLLVDAVLDAARGAGMRVALLEVRRANAAAIALYERAGFRSYGVRRGYYRSPPDDALQLVAEIVQCPGRRESTRGVVGLLAGILPGRQATHDAPPCG